MQSTQRYVSNELTHFVGRGLEADEERYSLLVKILKDKNTPEANKARYTRAFDFHPKGPEKDAALLELLQ